MEGVDTFIGIIVPFVNFAVFIGLAIYFFKNPARKAAQKKRADFEALMAAATKAKDAAEAKLGELQSRMSGLDQEIQKLKDTAKAAAEAEAEKIVADAERLGEHLKAEAKRVAAAEADKARQTLRDEIVAEAKKVVSSRLKTELSSSDHAGLVAKRVDSLNSVSAEG